MEVRHDAAWHGRDRTGGRRPAAGPPAGTHSWRGDHIERAPRASTRPASWEELHRRPSAKLGRRPALAFVYGDVEGNIGFFPAGEVPVRVGFDGDPAARRPSDDSFEWQGVIPHELKPRIFNPEERPHRQREPSRCCRRIAPIPLGARRPRRLTVPARIDELHPHEPARSGSSDFERIQQDRYDAVDRGAARPRAAGPARRRPARERRPRRAPRMGRAHDVRPGASRLRRASTSSCSRSTTFRDELGDRSCSRRPSSSYLEAASARAASTRSWRTRSPPSGTTAGTPRRREPGTANSSPRASRASLLASRLAERLGGRRRRLGLGDASTHRLLPSIPLGQRRVASAGLLNRGPSPFGGSTHHDRQLRGCRCSSPSRRPRARRFRFLADLAATHGRSRAVVPSGVSGHPLSPHYFDQNPAWLSAAASPTLLDTDGRDRQAHPAVPEPTL